MKSRHFLLIIFFVAFVLRAIFALSLQPHFFWSDETGYYNIALNLCERKGYTNDEILVPQSYMSATNFNNKTSFCFAPALPFTLAGIICITGQNITVVRLIQVLFASILPVVAFWMCIRLFNSLRTAYIAAIISAVYPYFIYISSVFYPQAFFSVLLALTILFFVSWLRDGRTRWLILTGITNGAACLFVVPTIFTVIPIGVIILYRLVLRRVSLLAPAIFLFFWAVIVGPYIMYASRMNNRFVMITKQENVGLHRFNHPDLTVMEVFSHTLTQESREKVNRLGTEFLLSINPQAAAGQWFKQMLKDHPLLFMRNCLLRLFALFAPVTFTITDNAHTGLVPNLVGIFIYLPLFLMSIAGLLRMSRQKDWAGLQVVSLLLFFLVPYILLIGNTRYRLPWDSLMICFAAYYISNIVAGWIDKLKTTQG